jgi:hypothetical protein
MFVTTPELLDLMCCGAVAGGVKFCMLRSSECTFTTHSKKVEVASDAIYISTGRNCAFSHHHAPVSRLEDSQLPLLLSEQHSKEDWIRLLRGLNQAMNVDEEGGLAQVPKQVSILEAFTPRRKRKARYEEPILGDGDSLFLTPGKRDQGRGSRDSGDDELVILPSEDSEDQGPEEHLVIIIAQWGQVVGAINKIGSSVHALRGTMSEDIGDLESKLLDVDARVGTLPLQGGFEDCGTLCDGLSQLWSHRTDLVAKCDALKAAFVGEVNAASSRLSNQIQSVREEMDRKVARNLMEIQAAFEGVGDAIKVLGAEQEKLTEHVLRDPGWPGTSTTSSRDLTQFAARLKAVEARLPMSLAGHLGRESVQTKVDVLHFVEEYVPANCFYLFHDVVTLLESLTTSHVERKDVLQEWYQSAKVGVNEASARHMASFRLVLPTVFGRTKGGSPSNAKYHLPSVKTFKDWNTFDGMSGVKGYIRAGMEDLRYQFQQDIDHVLDLSQHTKARLLAMEMLESSQNFVMKMSSWINAFFQELVTTSEATEEEAWEVVGVCIQKMFKVLRVPRAQAANATMDPDAKSQCATYLWALVQSHRIMKDFLDSRFCNHGAIALVIVLHIFKMRVTRVSLSATIKRLEGRLSAVERSREKDGKVK